MLRKEKEEKARLIEQMKVQMQRQAEQYMMLAMGAA